MGNAGKFSWEFEAIAKHTLDIILIIDEHQIVRYVTPSCETILGMNRKKLWGKMYLILYILMIKKV